MLRRLLLLLPLLARHVICQDDDQIIHVIYWNSSNVLFEPFTDFIDSPGFYEMLAEPGDILKFHCPRRTKKEYSIIYQVTSDDFEVCSLSATSLLVGVCDGHKRVHSLQLQRYPSYAQKNYYISTSSGTLEGIEDRRHGLCMDKNMRLAVDMARIATKHEDLLPVPDDIDQDVYLAEENGELNWKRNVAPDLAYGLKLKFERSRKIEPIVMDDLYRKFEENKAENKLRDKKALVSGASVSCYLGVLLIFAFF